MRPINGAPGLGSINGFGVAVYGERDRDPETYTYIKTHCVTALFLPVLCLGAYRVADAEEEGWYFLGKEPLSMLAKVWNVLVLAAVLSVGGGMLWNSHTNSPEYQAREKLDAGDTAAEEGDHARAATLYYEVAIGSSDESMEGRNQLAAMIHDGLEDAKPEDAIEVYDRAMRLKARKGKFYQVDRLFESGLALSDHYATENPHGALLLLESIESLAESPAGVEQRKRALLERLVKENPTDVEVTSKLAVLLEAEENIKGCKKLLVPLESKLGASEGARILGQIYARDGKLEQSDKLLVPYCESQLKELHVAEDAMNATYEKVYNAIYAELQSGEAAGFSYKQHESKTEADQNAMVEGVCEQTHGEQRGDR